MYKAGEEITARLIHVNMQWMSRRLTFYTVPTVIALWDLGRVDQMVFCTVESLGQWLPGHEHRRLTRGAKFSEHPTIASDSVLEIGSLQTQHSALQRVKELKFSSITAIAFVWQAIRLSSKLTVGASNFRGN